MSGIVAFEGELNSIVKEYLEFSNFDKTLNVFDEECAEKGKPVAPTDGQPKSDEKLISIQFRNWHLWKTNNREGTFGKYVNDMLKQFHLGRNREFFQLWNEYIPDNVRSDDIVAQKLEFYLHIYFAIHPLKKGEKVTHEDVETGMANFKSYLETRGSSLSQTTEFLPFYALPFVPNPKVHPSYKELFSDKWAPELSDRLDKFLTLALQSVSQSRLFQLFSARGKSIDSLEQKLNDSERRAGAYMKRYNRIQGDYHNLISITADLVDSLEATVQGNPVSPEYLQQICVRLFSNQVRQSVDLTRPGTAAEVLRQSVMPPQGLQQGEAAPNVSLDYDKIKEDVSRGTERTVALLLQALRWKLTKTSPPERDAMLAAYINNDVLGCVRPGAYRKAVLRHLNSDSEVVRQYAARLFNAFASLCDGRSYLSQNPHLMRSLMDNLRADDRDSLTRENVLGCLQKLSLRRALQSLMIEEGIIGWLVSVLEDNDSLSDYTLEYSIALLMNLCLRAAGKRKCTELSQLLLKVLTDLLGHDNKEIIPYVNGTLYSVLAMPAIREEAKAMGMEEILCCFVKEDQPDMNRQIEFIVKQLNSTEDPEDTESDDEEDDEEDEEDQDAMETDLDKAELLKLRAGELCGDRLLNTYYVSTVSPPIYRKRKPHDSVAAIEEVLQRPVTPSQLKGGDAPIVHIQPRARNGAHSSLRNSSIQNSRPNSRDLVRPPTRCGSSNGTTPRVAPPVATDNEGSELVGKALGQTRTLAMGTDSTSVKPSPKALQKVNTNGTIVEYQAAFSSRPRIARTPDGGRPTSRGSVGDGPLPQPKYSDSLPTPRPSSGGRSSSNSALTPPGSASPRVQGGGKRSRAR